jgi:hypothetical protein
LKEKVCAASWPHHLKNGGASQNVRDTILSLLNDDLLRALFAILFSCIVERDSFTHAANGWQFGTAGSVP